MFIAMDPSLLNRRGGVKYSSDNGYKSGKALFLVLNIILSLISATLRVSGCLEKSAEVMKVMQELVNVPEVMGTARELSKEMMKVNLIIQNYL